MTKEEYLNMETPFEKWKTLYKKEIEETITKITPWFHCEQFIQEHLHIANEIVIKIILKDAFENYNYDDGEFEGYIAAKLCIPFSEVVRYRTKKFWDELKNNHERKKEMTLDNFSKEQLADIIRYYVEVDYEAASDPFYVQETLEGCGIGKEEAEALGIGYVFK